MPERTVPAFVPQYPTGDIWSPPAPPLSSVALPVEEPREALPLRPRGARVFIRPVDIAEKRASGILMPQIARKRSNEGTVIEIGPGRQLESSARQPIEDLHVGDRVLYLRWTAYAIECDGMTLMVVDEADIIAVADGDSEVELGFDGANESR